MNIKRFDCLYEIYMGEHVDGPWVSHTDHIAALEANRLAEKIEDLIEEFGDDPKAALDCISEWISFSRHNSAPALEAVKATVNDAEPFGYVFQHDETGLVQVVDVQQVEWGFEKNNPRLKNIGPVYLHPPAVRAVEEKVKLLEWINAEQREALQWYEENARLCRLESFGSDSGRKALAEDGGIRARAALNPISQPKSTAGRYNHEGEKW